MVYQPCLQQLAMMVKQAGLDHIATTDGRARLLDAIQRTSQSGGQPQLSLQVIRHQHRFIHTVVALSLGWGDALLTALQALADTQRTLLNFLVVHSLLLVECLFLFCRSLCLG